MMLNGVGKGAEWNGVEWNGVERNGAERNGVERNGVGNLGLERRNSWRFQPERVDHEFR